MKTECLIDFRNEKAELIINGIRMSIKEGLNKLSYPAQLKLKKILERYGLSTELPNNDNVIALSDFYISAGRA